MARPSTTVPHVDVPIPPGASPSALRLARAVATPIERFLAISASSGIVLLVATAVALGLANSPWAEAYEGLWRTTLALELGPLSFTRDLRFWVNDGLMAIFFFVIALEIRREIHRGELSEWRRASLPLVAGLGGMVVPALVYTGFNLGTPAQSGWGTPMATDIAFAVGVLALLGKRVPASLRMLLLALAVIDDLGAILVIALFYTTELSLLGFGVAVAGLGAIIVMQRFGVRAPLAYVPAALVTWAGTYAGGVHPTIAGVAIGLFTPVAAWYGPAHLRAHLDHARGLVAPGARPSEDELIGAMTPLRTASLEVVSPVDRLIALLHGWVAFGIMPLFALANAGVAIGGAGIDGEAAAVFSGITLGLVLGKPVGIVAACWLAIRTGLARLPAGLRQRDLTVVGLVAGIGFTMALFIAQLGMPAGPLLESAKLAVLTASAIAAVAGLALGWLLLPAPDSSAANEPRR